MSTVLKFRQGFKRKPGFIATAGGTSNILRNINTILSDVGNRKFQTVEEVREAILLLDFTNKCIRLVIVQIESESTRNKLMTQSETIDQLIADTRNNVLFNKSLGAINSFAN